MVPMVLDWKLALFLSYSSKHYFQNDWNTAVSYNLYCYGSTTTVFNLVKLLIH